MPRRPPSPGSPSPGSPPDRALPVEDVIPDVRDGLTRRERVVLYTLHEVQKERAGRSVPTAMLWGRVVERLDMSQHELVAILQRLGAADPG